MIEFHLDGHSKVATYMQIVQQVKQSLRTGVLGSGDQLPKVREIYESQGLNATPTTPQQFAQYIAYERRKWASVVHEARIAQQ